MSNNEKILQEYREFNAPVRRAIKEMKARFLAAERTQESKTVLDKTRKEGIKKR
jgi:hypothetical protein